jgi:hypothetical protein
MKQLRHTQGSHFEEPRYLTAGEHRVTLNDGSEGSVEITGREGLEIILHTRTGGNSYSFVALVEGARRGALPCWVEQIPALMTRINDVFAKERAERIDPHHRVGINGDEIYFEDLKRGVRIGRSLRDLKADLARGRALPDIYDVPAIRAALGLEVTAA